MATYDGDGPFEVSLSVDGEQSTETVTSTWRRTIDVSGDFNVVLSTSAPNDDDEVVCTIALAEGSDAPLDEAERLERVTQSSDGTATCSMSGTISNSSTQIRTDATSERRVYVGRPDPQSISFSSVEMMDGAFAFQVPSTWTADDRYTGEVKMRNPSGIVEPRAFSDSDFHRVADFDDEFSDGNISLRRSDRPLAFRGTVLEMAEQYVAGWRASNDESFGSVSDPVTVDLDGVESAVIDFDITGGDGFTARWHLFRVGTDLFLLTEYPPAGEGSGIDEIVASMRIDRSRLPLISHWTRISFIPEDRSIAPESVPTFSVPADYEVGDDDRLVLTGASSGVEVFPGAVRDADLDGFLATQRSGEATESEMSIAGTPATTFTSEADGITLIEIAIPTGPAEAFRISYRFRTADRPVVDEMISRIRFD